MWPACPQVPFSAFEYCTLKTGFFEELVVGIGMICIFNPLLAVELSISDLMLVKKDVCIIIMSYNNVCTV